MAKCVDNTRLGRIGCGQEYSGKLQHCVAKVPWSEFPDGRAHITASLSVIDSLWKDGILVDPSTVGLIQDSKRNWRKPLSDRDRRRLATIRSKTDAKLPEAPEIQFKGIRDTPPL